MTTPHSSLLSSSPSTTLLPRPSANTQRDRTCSFSFMEPEQTSGILASILRESKVFLGGGSIGKGLNKAARFYLKERLDKAPIPAHFTLPGAHLLCCGAEEDRFPLEESFYVVDIGVLVSQVYQWRKYFPRIEPFYAVKCNPDPVIVKTLAVLGCNFDCASRNEIRLVHSLSQDLPRTPEIIYANPCKSRAHLLEAVCKGVTLVTFDNAAEIEKCARISKQLRMVLRIVTDDRGSQCRLSSKFGAPRAQWRPLLQTLAKQGMNLVGVSFHVGSGCRDASRYQLALEDARQIFDMAKEEFGWELNILDIGGGFPGETHSVWNPEVVDEVPSTTDSSDEYSKEGMTSDSEDEPFDSDHRNDHFMFFNEIAEQVAPMVDALFPPESGVRIIAEPGRFFVAACSTLCCSVIGVRTNAVNDDFTPEPVDDKEIATALAQMTREEEKELVGEASKNVNRSLRKFSMGGPDADEVLGTIVEELADYSRLFARQNLAQQEADVYNDSLDIYSQDFKTASDILGPPEEDQRAANVHTVEGMNYPLVSIEEKNPEDTHALITLAAAGEAAVNGVVLQAVADSAPLQDDYAYYINDGVYGAFNNIMFDHATVRPRVLRETNGHIFASRDKEGFVTLESSGSGNDDPFKNQTLYGSTVFGPTCDSIDVVARSVLLPKMKIGDWLYFQNMGAYTMAASSSFNGFVPSEKLYVCSVQPEYFEALVAGPDTVVLEEKKVDN